MDKSETHRLEFWVNCFFFFSNETIFGKFYMGLGIVWVMKPREREREREREMLPNQREERFHIREITIGCRVE